MFQLLWRDFNTLCDTVTVFFESNTMKLYLEICMMGCQSDTKKQVTENTDYKAHFTDMVHFELIYFQIIVLKHIQ